jgi:hypothetical protein
MGKNGKTYSGILRTRHFFSAKTLRTFALSLAQTLRPISIQPNHDLDIV